MRTETQIDNIENSKGVFDDVRKKWNESVSKIKKIPEDKTDLSQKIIKLYERQQNFHAKCVTESELKKYHRSFTFEENFLLLILVREQIADDRFPILLGWKTVTDAAIGAVQL